MGNICSCFEAPMEEINYQYIYNKDPIDNYFNSYYDFETIYRLCD